MADGTTRLFEKRRRLLWLTTGGALFMFLIISLVNQPLTTPVSPAGMITFQLAGTPERAQEIIAAWNARGQLFAAFSLGLDYLFMLAYAVAISLACFSAGEVLREKSWPLGGGAGFFASGAWAAAGLDALENLALGLVLLGPAGSPWPQVARFCALVKFLFIFLGLVYVFYGLAVVLLGKLLPGSPSVERG